MPLQQRDQYGRLISEVYDKEEVENQRIESEAAWNELSEFVVMLFPVVPLFLLGYGVGYVMHARGVHLLFDIVAGLVVAAAPIWLLAKVRIARMVYACALVPVGAFFVFGLVTDHSDMIWGGAAGIAALIGGIFYARHWIEEFC